LTCSPRHSASRIWASSIHCMRVSIVFLSLEGTNRFAVLAGGLDLCANHTHGLGIGIMGIGWGKR
jgi:hypothetical protein